MITKTKTTWRTVRLGDVASNFDSKRRPLSSMQRATMRGTYPYYGAAEVFDHINDYIFDGLHLLVAEDGTVTTDDSHPVLQLADGKFWVNNHAHIIKGEDDEDTKYLYYALSTVGINPYITGAVQLKITQQNLNSIEISFPEKSERQKLVRVLSAFDEKIENNNRIIKTLEEMAQAIFKEWFESGSLNGAEQKNLFDILSVTYGYPFKSALFNEKKNGLPVIRIRNILDGQTSTYTPEKVGERYVVNDGDILVGMDGQFHLRMWSSGTALLNQRVVRFRPKNNSGWFFAYLSLQKPIRQKELSAVGTTVAHLSDKDLKSIFFSTPDDGLKQRFDNLADDYYWQIVNLLRENQKLAAMRDLLLPRLMSGEIRV